MRGSSPRRALRRFVAAAGWFLGCILVMAACTVAGQYRDDSGDGSKPRVTLPPECGELELQTYCTEIEILPITLLEIGFKLTERPRVILLPDGRLRYVTHLKDPVGDVYGAREDYEIRMDYHGWTSLPSGDPNILRFRGAGSRDVQYIAVIRLSEGFRRSSGQRVSAAVVFATLETVTPVWRVR